MADLREWVDEINKLNAHECKKMLDALFLLVGWQIFDAVYGKEFSAIATLIGIRVNDLKSK